MTTGRNCAPKATSCLHPGQSDSATLYSPAQRDPACKECGAGSLTWPTAGERQRDVSVSDRGSPLITVRSGTPRAHPRAHPRLWHASGVIAQTVLAAFALALAIASLLWQAWTYQRSGSRFLVEAQIGVLLRPGPNRIGGLVTYSEEPPGGYGDPDQTRI